MDKAQLKQKVFAAIDANAKELIALGRDIQANPELGYKEFETAKKVQAAFDKLGMAHTDNLAITGIKSTLKGKNHNANVAILGELDAVVVPDHPRANKQTGAAHACGHFAQLITMLGAATGFSQSGVMDKLDGDVTFMAVPAEEFVEMEFRNQLKKEGKVTYLSGKQEMIKVGAFDDVDISMMCHSGAAENPHTSVWSNTNGFMGKLLNFKGKASHAGGAPELGVNALDAASLAIAAINAQRTTFKDQDMVRVHPIITKGGDLVNVVPSDVRMEMHVRANNIDAIVDAHKKVNRAAKGAAYAMGAEVDITEISGHLPLQNCPDVQKIIDENTKLVCDDAEIVYGPTSGGTTDMGDVCSIMPGAHMMFAGFCGGAHQPDFEICDEEAAFIIPAKIMAAAVIDLLCDGAKEAVEIKKNFKAPLTKDEYLRFWDNLIED